MDAEEGPLRRLLKVTFCHPGDALLEPFWPQGLGSNRGFHSALDAVWAVHVMQTEGLEVAPLELSCMQHHAPRLQPYAPRL